MPSNIHLSAEEKQSFEMLPPISSHLEISESTRKVIFKKCFTFIKNPPTLKNGHRRCQGEKTNKYAKWCLVTPSTKQGDKHEQASHKTNDITHGCLFCEYRVSHF